WASTPAVDRRCGRQRGTGLASYPGIPVDCAALCDVRLCATGAHGRSPLRGVELTGPETESVHRRDAILSDADLAEALAKLGERVRIRARTRSEHPPQEHGAPLAQLAEQLTLNQ